MPDKDAALVPQVTVLMSVHNGQQFLRQAVDSILGQTFTDFEFLIFDDHSTDGSLEILRSYDDPRIRLVENEVNRGLTWCLTKGLEIARAELIARMDADDVSLPYRLERQVAFLYANPDVALVGSSMDVIDSNGGVLSRIEVPTDSGVIHRTLLVSNCIVHPSVTFRRKIVIAAGGYQGSAGKYAQDYDLWLRLSEQSKLANLPEPLLRYRSHSEQISFAKVYPQMKAAYTYRRMATERRAAKGETIDALVFEQLSRTYQLQGGEGSLGKSYFNLGLSYEASGDRSRAFEAYCQAARHSPLSMTTWKKLAWDFPVSPRRKSILRWYWNRIFSTMLSRH